MDRIMSGTPRTPFLGGAGSTLKGEISGLTSSVVAAPGGVPQTSPNLRSVILQKERELSNLNEQRVITLEARIRDLESSLASRDGELERFKLQMGEIERDFSYNLKLISERDREIQRLERENADMKRQFTEADQARAKAEARLEEAEAQSSEMAARIRRDVTDLQERAVRELEAKRAELMDELARVRQESAHDWSQRLAIAQAEGAEMRARAELALQENAQLSTTLASSQRDLDRAVGQFEESVEALRGAQQGMKALEAENEAMRRELQARGEALERARAELQGADRRAEEGAALQREAESARADLEDARRRIDRLEGALREAEKGAVIARDDLRRSHDAAEEEGRLQLRALDQLRRQLDDARLAAADLEAQREACRAQLGDLERAVVERGREAAAATSRALKAEEQVSHLLRQVEELGNQLHVRALENEHRAQGNWERYVAVLTEDRDRALEEVRATRRRLEDSEAEALSLRGRIKRAEETIEYLREGTRVRASLSPPPLPADPPPPALTAYGGSVHLHLPPTTHPTTVTATGGTARATLGADPPYAAYSATPGGVVREGGSAAPPQPRAPAPAAAATTAAVSTAPASCPGGSGSVRGAVDRFARKLEDLSYENSKLKYKVSDLKSRIHTAADGRESLPPRGPAHHSGDTLMGYAEAVLNPGEKAYSARAAAPPSSGGRTRGAPPAAFTAAPLPSMAEGGATSAPGSLLDRPVLESVSAPKPLFQMGPARAAPPPGSSAAIRSPITTVPDLGPVGAPRIDLDISNTVPSFTDRGPNPRLDRAKDKILEAKKTLAEMPLGNPGGAPVTRFPDRARFDAGPEVEGNKLRTSKLDSLKTLLRSGRGALEATAA